VVGRQSLDESPIRIAILSAAIFIVALSVRLVPLGFYVTPDEPIWVMRSVEFLQACGASRLDRQHGLARPGEC